MSLDVLALVRAAATDRGLPEAALAEAARAALEALGGEVYEGYDIEVRIDGEQVVVAVAVEVTRARGEHRGVVTPLALSSAGIDAEEGDGFVLTLHTFPESPRPALVAGVLRLLKVSAGMDAAFLAQAPERVAAALAAFAPAAEAPATTEFVAELRAALADEVPEIASGEVQLVRVAWDEASRRGKVAVRTDVRDLDPVGAMYGARGARIRAVTTRLACTLQVVDAGGDPYRVLTDALHPAGFTRWEINLPGRRVTLVDPTYVYDRVELPTEAAREAAFATNLELATALTGWTMTTRGRVSFIEAGVPRD